MAGRNRNGRGKNGGWFGWADDPKIEKLKEKFVRASSLEEQKRLPMRSRRKPTTR